MLNQPIFIIIIKKFKKFLIIIKKFIIIIKKFIMIINKTKQFTIKKYFHLNLIMNSYLLLYYYSEFIIIIIIIIIFVIIVIIIMARHFIKNLKVLNFFKSHCSMD